LKTPKWRRAEKAVSTLRSFVERHSKIEDVKIGKWVNESIWKRGAKNPPSRVRVDVKRTADTVIVELSELPKKSKTKEIPEKVEEKTEVKKVEKAKEVKPTTKKKSPAKPKSEPKKKAAPKKTSKSTAKKPTTKKTASKKTK